MLRRRIFFHCIPDRSSHREGIVQHGARVRSRLRYAFATKYVKEKHVLDIGAGEGIGYDTLLAANPASVTSIDLHQGAKKRFSHSKNVTYITNDVLQHKFNKKFDVVLCFATLYYIKDHPLLLKKIRSVLKRGGILIIDTYSADYVFRYAQCELRDISKKFSKTYDAKHFREVLGYEFSRVKIYIQDTYSKKKNPLAYLGRFLHPLKIAFGRHKYKELTKEKEGVYLLAVARR